MVFKQRVLVGASLISIAGAAWVDPSVLDACAGYTLQNPLTEGAVFTADLVLAGNCSVFGADIEQLALTVEYETGEYRTSSNRASPLNDS